VRALIHTLLYAALLCGLAGLGHAREATPAVVIKGLDRAATENLRLHLGDLDLTAPNASGRLERQLREALDAALQPFGWYESTYRLDTTNGKTVLRVDPGPRITWIAADLRIDPAARALPELDAILRSAPLAPGTPLLHEAYDELREDLLQACRRAGFLHPRYQRAELRVDPLRREAQAVLDLATGPRSRFGDIRVSGSQLDATRLVRLAPFRPGDWFDAAALMRFEQRLRDTGYFRELAIRVNETSADRADIDVLAADVTETRYDVGAGFSTDSELRLRFGRHSPLLNARGDALSIDLEASGTQQSLESTWRIPHDDPLDDVFEVTAGLQGKDIADTESLTATTGIAHAMRIFSAWSLRFGVSAELERYRVGSETQKDVAYLMPAATLSRAVVAPGLDPGRGSRIWTSVDFSDSAVGAPADFVRWRGGGALLRGFSDDLWRLLLRAELGALWTNAFNEVPASLRFYAGGDQSIRGYDYQTLAPRDENGKIIGGKYLAVGSVEVSRRVHRAWRIAAFVDGGGAFTEDQDDRYQSAGIGLRWRSPIGQIRFDVAMPIGDEDKSSIKLHVSVEPPL
jgi:translocation and assembly module TamA